MILIYLVVCLTRSVLSCFSTNDVITEIADFLCNTNSSLPFEFEHLGSFNSDYWRCQPEAPDELKPKLLYYDKKHSKNPADLKWNETDFSVIGEPPDWPQTIFVFTHGFVDSIKRRDSTEWMDPSRKKLVEQGYGVILFDWSSGAGTFYNYALAASNTRVAGRMLGHFLNNLKTDFSRYDKLQRSDLFLHLVGHSLGAHVCGQAGYYYSFISGGEKIERIDGLDPAGPLFLDQQAFDEVEKIKPEYQNTSKATDEITDDGYFVNFQSVMEWFESLTDDEKNLKIDKGLKFKEGIKNTVVNQKTPAPESSRLDRTDAKLVTVIHTNAFGFGVFENIGHIDFWPNGGIQQEGCLTLFHVIDENMSKCSHRFAHKLWEESLKPESSKKIITYKCSKDTKVYEYSNATCTTPTSEVAIGFKSDMRADNASGVYYVDTSKMTAKPSNLLEFIVRIIVVLIMSGIVFLAIFAIYKVQQRPPSGRPASNCCHGWGIFRRRGDDYTSTQRLNGTPSGVENECAPQSVIDISCSDDRDEHVFMVSRKSS